MNIKEQLAQVFNPSISAQENIERFKPILMHNHRLKTITNYSFMINSDGKAFITYIYYEDNNNVILKNTLKYNVSYSLDEAYERARIII